MHRGDEPLGRRGGGGGWGGRGRRETKARPIVRPSKVRRWIFAAAAAILPAGLLHAALPPTSEVAGPVTLAGQLLVAAPEFRQSAFYHAVILIARHNADGALGIVINRPVRQHAVAELLKGFGVDAGGVTGSVRVLSGGPVDPTAGFVVHSAEYRREDTLDIDGRVALSTGPDVLRDIGSGRGPKKSLVAFGYAGWGPAQLEGELAHGTWVTVPEDPALVFDDDRAKIWAEAMARPKTVR
jgi:putative transcriptional regulator